MNPVPDPGGPKTCGSGESGSGTLLVRGEYHKDKKPTTKNLAFKVTTETAKLEVFKEVFSEVLGSSARHVVFRRAGRECRVQTANPPGGGTAPAALRASASEQLATADRRIQLGQLATANRRVLTALKISFKKTTEIKVCI